MAADPHPPSTAVDAYIDAQPAAYRAPLQRLRAIVHEEVPAAREALAFGIPCFYHHYQLVGIGVKNDAVAFYAMNVSVMARFRDRLGGARAAGSTLFLPPGDPLPEELIRAVIRARVVQNEARAADTGGR